MTIILNGTTGVTFPNGVTMSDGTSAPVTVAQGGTGANTASAARTSLGVAIGTDVLAPNGSGANLTSLNASNISSGTLSNDRLGIVSVAKGGTGTATPSLVAGSNISITGTWPNQTVTGTTGAPTTAQVLSATAGATAGDVGTYAYVIATTGTNPSGGEFGGTKSGSVLRPAAIYQAGGYAVGSPTSLSGTWRSMGCDVSASYGSNNLLLVYLRIS